MIKPCVPSTGKSSHLNLKDMISQHLINEIKSLSKGLSRTQLDAKYFEALELLPAETVQMIRDSLIEESTPVSSMFPDLSSLY